jgi:hypothetical protein
VRRVWLTVAGASKLTCVSFIPAFGQEIIDPPGGRCLEHTVGLLLSRNSRCFWLTKQPCHRFMRKR